MSTINDVVNSYYNVKDKYNDVAAFAALTADSDDSLRDFVDYLEKNVPSDVVISGFTISSGAVSISGKARKQGICCFTYPAAAEESSYS